MKQKNTFRPFPLAKAFQFMEPGPVVLVSTAHKGKANVMTMSWHMVVDFTPQFACIIGPWDYSYKALRATGECVIAIPTVDLIAKVVDIGNCTGKEVDKFEKFGLHRFPAGIVQAPLIAECLANIECRVSDTSLENKHGLLLLDGIQAWINPSKKERRTFHANGDGTFVVDGKKLDYRKKMIKLP